ncbi:MAG: 4-diphosphocytidyl-2-C-methyl-D-erythritol kinase [Frankiales bacterium]|nr:4-diphosphocytidyl-2-C-methyl-D-erythritol kinase [Frankiales bacterium]
MGALRPDGFHDLTTVYQAVGLYDEVTIERADALTVTVEGPGADLVPLDATNLAARAVVLLAERSGNDPRVAVHLRKGIPVAGGCAGGSADAAAALVGCDALWGALQTRDQLARCAAELGSDVPFSLHGGTALGTGRGERLTPVLGQGSYSWVLALSDLGLSTPAVYDELDRQRETGPVGVVSDPSEVLAALRSGDAVALGHALGNDLQPAALALAPSLRPLLEAARSAGALGAIVSGSGPTVAVLARDDGHGKALAAALERSGTCDGVRQASGPAPGARVVHA